MKKIIVADQAAMTSVANEIRLWQQVSSCENIVKIVGVEKILELGNQVVLILMEYCSEGTLFDLLTKYQGKLSE